MTEVKHTPGPWFVGAQNDGLYVLDGQPSPAPYDGPIPRSHGPNVVATPNFRLPGYEANARLIAAAPDLLAAAQWAERALAPFSKEPAEKSGISRLRAAIARAS